MADRQGAHRWRPVVVAAGLAAILSGLGWSRHAEAQSQFNGAWAGLTSLQTVVSFTVASNAITSFAITFPLAGIGCGGPGSIVFDLSGAPIGIAGNSFSAVGTAGGVTFQFTGFFTSPVVASGSILATSQPTPTGAPCSGSASVSWSASPGALVGLTAAVLPGSRSVVVGQPATAFAAIANGSPGTALGCRITTPFGLPATFAYQTTNPTTNQPIGRSDTPVDIPAGGVGTFLVTVTPSGPFAPVNLALQYQCENSVPAPSFPGVNALLLSASTAPVPDVIALAATQTGDGIAVIPGPTGTGAFAVATVNVGAGATLTVSADTGQTSVPVTIAICPTDPGTGACLADPAPVLAAAIGTSQTPTFAVFVTALRAVPFAPDVNRVFVRFSDQAGAIRGSTSVAVQTSAQ